MNNFNVYTIFIVCLSFCVILICVMICWHKILILIWFIFIQCIHTYILHISNYVQNQGTVAVSLLISHNFHQFHRVLSTWILVANIKKGGQRTLEWPADSWLDFFCAFSSNLMGRVYPSWHLAVVDWNCGWVKPHWISWWRCDRAQPKVTFSTFSLSSYIHPKLASATFLNVLTQCFENISVF